ncbi:hypothetical protein HQ487_04880 [Candidatus Uhrbacteria bacterium]|nr:hypothetical protein [Candidatus Uhrbacteria bacterium]
MKKSFFWALIALVFLGAGCFRQTEPIDLEEVSSTIDRDSILFEAQKNGLIMNEEEIQTMSSLNPTEDSLNQTPTNIDRYLQADVIGWKSAALADVTGGGSFGIAHAQYLNGTYTMVVTMGNLTDPADDYFYEGWIVHRGTEFSVMSTGRAVKTGDGYANVYLSKADLSESDFYVLTLEPDDGNPAPAEHILEGTFK